MLWKACNWMQLLYLWFLGSFRRALLHKQQKCKKKLFMLRKFSRLHFFARSNSFASLRVSLSPLSIEMRQIKNALAKWRSTSHGDEKTWRFGWKANSCSFGFGSNSTESAGWVIDRSCLQNGKSCISTFQAIRFSSSYKARAYRSRDRKAIPVSVLCRHDNRTTGIVNEKKQKLHDLCDNFLTFFIHWFRFLFFFSACARADSTSLRKCNILRFKSCIILRAFHLG